MYLNELLSCAVLKEVPDQQADVVLVRDGTFPWSDISMVVPRQDWEGVFVRNRAKEPDIEPVFTAILDGNDRDFMRYLGNMEAVQSRYSELRAEKQKVDLESEASADGASGASADGASGESTEPIEEKLSAEELERLQKAERELEDELYGRAAAVSRTPAPFGAPERGANLQDIMGGMVIPPSGTEQKEEDNIDPFGGPVVPRSAAPSSVSETQGAESVVFEFGAPNAGRMSTPSDESEGDPFGGELPMPCANKEAPSAFGDFTGFGTGATSGVKPPEAGPKSEGQSVFGAEFDAHTQETQVNVEGQSAEVESKTEETQSEAETGTETETAQSAVKVVEVSDTTEEQTSEEQAPGQEEQPQTSQEASAEEQTAQKEQVEQTAFNKQEQDQPTGDAEDSEMQEQTAKSNAFLGVVASVRSLPNDQLYNYQILVGENSDPCTGTFSRLLNDYRDLEGRITFYMFKSCNNVTSERLVQELGNVMSSKDRLGTLESFHDFIVALVLGYGDAMECMASGDEEGALDIVKAFAKYIYEG